MKGSTGPQPLRCNPRKKGSQQDINRAAARAGPRQGELPSLLCGRSHDRRPISDRDSPGRTNGNAVSNPRIRQGQPRTNKWQCGIQPAHQSLITDVFTSRPLLCTIHHLIIRAVRAENVPVVPAVLDKGHKSKQTRRGGTNAALSCEKRTLATSYSITSSARLGSGSGMVMPSALAVLRFRNSSTFVPCWTGFDALNIHQLSLRSTRRDNWVRVTDFS